MFGDGGCDHVAAIAARAGSRAALNPGFFEQFWLR
jgi:hypothetical protein